ncbi:MAG: DUF3990 domain-containing protein [Bacteroidales bacterium]|nr:DUF3990 domain-containing protein [Bacteroidales bacterium]
MRLYHGTNTDFGEIKLSRCRPNKDFGQGFYLTDIRSQAETMAVRRCEFEESGVPIVQEYEFDEHLLDNHSLDVLRFEGVNEGWAEFILKNRMARGQRMHSHDIVVGPVADDGVVFQLNLYMQRLITLEILVKELTYRQLNNQYFFGTDRAIQQLKRV